MKATFPSRVAICPVAIAGCLMMLPSDQAGAALSYSIAGSTYSQNFNSLPNSPENASLGTTAGGFGWTDDNAAPPVNQFSIVGWYLYHPTAVAEGGANGNQRLRIGAGTASTGSFWSFGASSSTDRALGDVGANTLAVDGSDMYIGLRLHNDTGVTLGSFTLSYNGEQWRNGGNTEGLTFMWSTTATAISDPNTSFATVASLGYAAPVNGGTAAAVDGNTSGRVAVGPFEVTGISWQPGTDLWLRWADNQIAGAADHGLAIDDLVFAAQVPEPAVFALLGLGGLAMFIFRRRE